MPGLRARHPSFSGGSLVATLKIASVATDTPAVKSVRNQRGRLPDDRGSSLVEVLISIVLIGTTSVAGLVALRTSTISSATNRDHVNAHAWLQSASDVLYGAPRQDCGSPTAPTEAAVRAAYLDIVRGTSNPQGWPAANIEIVAPVKFWDGQSTYQSTCYDDLGVNLQLIKIQVRAPSGKILESVEIVKG